MFKKRHAIILKSISLILALLFPLEQLAHAAPVTIIQKQADISGAHLEKNAIQQILNDPSKMEIPFEHVTPREIHKGSNGKLIIHIQDAHSNLSGQQSLAGALDYLLSRYDIPLILVEGSDQDVSLGSIQELMDPKDLRMEAKKLLFEGLLSGEEFLNLTSDHSIKLLGIEDDALYEKNLKLYKDLKSNRKKSLLYLRKIQISINRIKNRLYPKEILKYEDLHQKENESDFVKTFEYLLELAKEKNVNLDNFPETKRFISIKSQESRISFAMVNQERDSLISRIPEKSVLRKLLLLEKSDSHSIVSQLMILNKILSLAKRNGINPDTFRNIIQYQQYLHSFQALKTHTLLDEINLLKEVVYQSYLNDENHFALRVVDHYTDLLHMAYQIKLTAKDFELLNKYSHLRETASWEAFLNRHLINLDYYDDLIMYDEVLEDSYPLIEEFYKVVSERDNKFLTNIEQRLKEEDQNIAFLITGGYHTDHLTKLLRQNNYSYVVLTPHVHDKTNHDKYEKMVLSGIISNEQSLGTARMAGAGSDRARHRLSQSHLSRLTLTQHILNLSNPEVSSEDSSSVTHKAGARLSEDSAPDEMPYKIATPMSRLIQRTMDIVFSFLALFLVIPLALITAVIVYYQIHAKHKTGQSVIFTQERTGYKGKKFIVYKFRTVMGDSSEPLAILQTLRRFRLDEIPQIINVLKGEMSFWGPRPADQTTYHSSPEFTAHYDKMMQLRKPGILSQFVLTRGEEQGLVGLSRQIQMDEEEAKKGAILLPLWELIQLLVFILQRLVTKVERKAFKRNYVHSNGHETATTPTTNEFQALSPDGTAATFSTTGKTEFYSDLDEYLPPAEQEVLKDEMQNKSDELKVSIVVPTLDSSDFIEGTLSNIAQEIKEGREQHPDRSVEIIVSLNGTGQERTLNELVRVQQNLAKDNVAVTILNLQGLDSKVKTLNATSDYIKLRGFDVVSFMDDDVRLSEGALHASVDHLVSSPDLFIVGPTPNPISKPRDDEGIIKRLEYAWRINRHPLPMTRSIFIYARTYPGIPERISSDDRFLRAYFTLEDHHEDVYKRLSLVPDKEVFFSLMSTAESHINRFNRLLMQEHEIADAFGPDKSRSNEWPRLDPVRKGMTALFRESSNKDRLLFVPALAYMWSARFFIGIKVRFLIFKRKFLGQHPYSTKWYASEESKNFEGARLVSTNTFVADSTLNDNDLDINNHTTMTTMSARGNIGNTTVMDSRISEIQIKKHLPNLVHQLESLTLHPKLMQQLRLIMSRVSAGSRLALTTDIESYAMFQVRNDRLTAVGSDPSNHRTFDFPGLSRPRSSDEKFASSEESLWELAEDIHDWILQINAEKSIVLNIAFEVPDDGQDRASIIQFFERFNRINPKVQIRVNLFSGDNPEHFPALKGKENRYMTLYRKTTALQLNQDNVNRLAEKKSGAFVYSDDVNMNDEEIIRRSLFASVFKAYDSPEEAHEAMTKTPLASEFKNQLTRSASKTMYDVSLIASESRVTELKKVAINFPLTKIIHRALTTAARIANTVFTSA